MLQSRWPAQNCDFLRRAAWRVVISQTNRITTTMQKLRLTLFVLGLTVTTPLSAADEGPKKRNVLFLIADDLNCDLHCYGHRQVKSPNIDALAKRGVRFERAYCQYPLCSPSRSSFLTGRRPNATHIITNSGGPKLGPKHPHFRDYIPDTVTLPQLFKQADYFVARVGKLYHYGVPNQIGTSGLDDPPSWQQVFNPRGRDKDDEDKIFSLEPGKFGGTLSWLAAEGGDDEQTDGIGAAEAIKLLEQHKDEPFFIAAGFYRPHTPYVAPKKYFDLYPLDTIEFPEISGEDRARSPALAYRSAKAEQETMTDRQRREAMQAYWASITFMDAQVGRVVAALDRLGLADNTIIVMMSDHGYHMYEHGLWQKMSLFENAARVPLIVAAPGAEGNGKSAAGLAELVDVYPTLADLCGLEAPDYLDGASQRAVLEDPSSSVKEAAYTQIFRGLKAIGYSVRTDGWRYTFWNEGRDGEQLYDMKSDPGETHNLAGDGAQAARVAELKQLVQRYAATADGP
jgi:iduronate 2-sulfatase